MDNHPHHTFGFLGPRFATPLTLLDLCAQNLSKIDHPISHLWLPVSKIVKGFAFFVRKFWIGKMKVATPVTFLALWVENLATLSHFWLFGTFFCFFLQGRSMPNNHVCHPFHSFGSLGPKFGTLLALCVQILEPLSHFWLSGALFVVYYKGGHAWTGNKQAWEWQLWCSSWLNKQAWQW